MVTLLIKNYYSIIEENILVNGKFNYVINLEDITKIFKFIIKKSQINF